MKKLLVACLVLAVALMAAPAFAGGGFKVTHMNSTVVFGAANYFGASGGGAFLTSSTNAGNGIGWGVAVADINGGGGGHYQFTNHGANAGGGASLDSKSFALGDGVSSTTGIAAGGGVAANGSFVGGIVNVSTFGIKF